MKKYLKNFLLIVSVISIGAIYSCKKQNNIPPSGTILLNGSVKESFKMGTSDNVRLSANVEGAESISWDFGDGRKSENKDITLSYPKSGTYTIKLSLKGADNETTIISKNVQVLDRLLKTIVINKVYWNITDPMFSEAGWPKTNVADVYVKIQELKGNDVYINGFATSAPVLYQTEMVRNVTNTYSNPISFNVPSNIVLDKVKLINRDYLISLIAKNTAGEYLLFSNRVSGGDQIIREESIDRNVFFVTTSFFSSVDLNCSFE